MAHTIIKGWKYRCNYGNTRTCANCTKAIAYQDTFWTYYDNDDYCEKCGSAGSKSMAATVSIVKAVKAPSPTAKLNPWRATTIVIDGPTCRDCNKKIPKGTACYYRRKQNPTANGTLHNYQCNSCNLSWASTSTKKLAYHKGKFTPHATPIKCDNCGLLINSNGSTYWFKNGGNPYGAGASHLICNPCYMKKFPSLPKPHQPTNWEPYTIYSPATCRLCNKLIQSGRPAFRKWLPINSHMIFRHENCHHGHINGPTAAPIGTWVPFALIHAGSCGKCLKVHSIGTSMMRRFNTKNSYDVECYKCHFGKMTNTVLAGPISMAGWPFPPADEEDDGTPPKHIDVGTVPTKEQCACFGGPRYEERAARELDKWMPYLRVLFGEPPVGCSFKKAIITHEGGLQEITVRLYYRPDYEKCVAYAEKVKTGLPEYWEKPKDSIPDVTPTNTEGWLKDGWKYKILSGLPGGWSCKRCGGVIVNRTPFFYHPKAHTSYNTVCCKCHKTLTGA